MGELGFLEDNGWCKTAKNNKTSQSWGLCGKACSFESNKGSRDLQSIEVFSYYPCDK